MEDTLQKGPEQVVTEISCEQPEVVEAHKEQTHVEDASVEKVIFLSSGQIEIDNMDVE